MEFELILMCGDKSFGGTLIIKDWDKVKDSQDAELALKTLFGPMYNKAVGELAKHAVNLNKKEQEND